MKLEDEIQQSKFRSAKHKAILNIVFTSGWINCKEQRLFKEYGISPQQYNVLRILRGQKGKPIGVNGIQERMLDKNSNASRLVDKLKDKNLISRIECKQDRRQVEIMITEEGTKLLANLDKIVEELDGMMTSISEEEAEQLNEILDKIRD